MYIFIRNVLEKLIHTNDKNNSYYIVKNSNRINRKWEHSQLPVINKTLQ